METQSAMEGGIACKEILGDRNMKCDRKRESKRVTERECMFEREKEIAYVYHDTMR